MFMNLFNIKLGIEKFKNSYIYVKLINKLYMGFDMFETVHKLSLYMMNIKPDPTTCYNLDLQNSDNIYKI